jgi:hypothetical protein
MTTKSLKGIKLYEVNGPQFKKKRPGFFLTEEEARAFIKKKSCEQSGRISRTPS